MARPLDPDDPLTPYIEKLRAENKALREENTGLKAKAETTTTPETKPTEPETKPAEQKPAETKPAEQKPATTTVPNGKSTDKPGSTSPGNGITVEGIKSGSVDVNKNWDQISQMLKDGTLTAQDVA